MFQYDFSRYAQTCENSLSLISDLSHLQLNKIPDTHNNNMIWNLAHIPVTLCMLSYGMAELPMPIDEKWINEFKKGTEPEREYYGEELENIKSLLTEPLKMLQEDLKENAFQNYKSYTTSYGLTLSSVEDALVFNDIHAGLHLGYMMALKKLVI